MVILPLVLLVLGPTMELGIFLAAVAALWPVLTQTQVGVRDVDPVVIDTARSLKLSWFKTQLSVVLPSALPNVVTGIRISTSLALLLAVGAGILAGAPGLGHRIVVAQLADEPDLAFGLILWSGLIGLGVALALRYAERRLFRGRPEEAMA